MIAITNGEVWTITDGVIEDGIVLIENGKIKAFGKDIEIPTEAEIVDAAGKIVMPGLIDAHTHVGNFNDGVGGGHSDGNETTAPITPHLRALDAVHPEDMAFQDVLEAGITTVMTGPGSANLVGDPRLCLFHLHNNGHANLLPRAVAGGQSLGLGIHWLNCQN